MVRLLTPELEGECSRMAGVYLGNFHRKMKTVGIGLLNWLQASINNKGLE